MSTPLRGKVNISGVEVPQDDIEKITVNLALNERIDTFRITINNEDDLHTSDYNEGNVVEIWIDRNNPPMTKVFKGIIEKKTVNVDAAGKDFLELEGSDYSVVFLNRYVVESYRDKEISLIVKDLIEKFAPSITTSHVDATTVTLQDIRFPYWKLSECLELLAKLAGLWSYYVDSLLDLHFFAPTSQDSGLTITVNDLAELEYADDITPVKNAVYVLGGVDLTVDQEKTGVAGGSLSLADYWYARPFSPTRSELKQLSLYLEKIGFPTSDLEGEIREELDGLPAGELIKEFRYSKNYLEDAAWKPISIEENLVTGKTYWIILKKIGDAENTYKWYHDGGATGTYAYSADGIDWTKSTATYELAFKTYYGSRVIAYAEDGISAGYYLRRDHIVKDPAILSRQIARRIANRELERMRDRVRDVEIPVQLDTILSPGQMVTVDVGNLVGFYKVQDVTLEVKPHLESYAYKVRLSQRSEGLEDYLKDLADEIRKTALGLEGIDTTTLVDWYQSLLDPIKLIDALYLNQRANLVSSPFAVTDLLTNTPKDSGTFVWGTAKWAFSDWG